MLRPRSEVRNLTSLSLHQRDKFPPSSIFLDHCLISSSHRGESVTPDRCEGAEGSMKETQSQQTHQPQPPTWNPVRMQTTSSSCSCHFQLFTTRKDSVPVSVRRKRWTSGFLFVWSPSPFSSPAQGFYSLSLFLHPLLVFPPPHLLHLFKNKNTKTCFSYLCHLSARLPGPFVNTEDLGKYASWYLLFSFGEFVQTVTV